LCREKKLKKQATWKPEISRWLCLMLALVSVVLGGFTSENGDKPQDSVRKLKTRVQPEYPELAKQMNIKGTARVLVTVSPDGTVKEVKELGGNPVLLDALTRAVKKWKYEPAATQSSFEVKYEFAP
jgi:TonB family protein